MKFFILFSLFLLPFSLHAQVWTSQTSGTTDALIGVYFVDENRGWVVGNPGWILHTMNGGNTWMDQSVGHGYLTDVHFVDEQNGWVVGNPGMILRTTNGGNTWVKQSSGTRDWLWAVHFVDANLGWVVGEGSTILHTTDGGNTWVRQASGHAFLNDVYFTDGNSGWVVGSSRVAGIILHTTDGGNSWANQSIASAGLSGVYFTDHNTGWAVGGLSTILHTTDGGNSWVSQMSTGLIYLNALYFIDANTGWVVGEAGTILNTTDGGNTWVSQPSGTTSWLGRIHFAGGNSGWAVGDAGIILHYSDGEMPPPVSVAASVSPTSGTGSFNFTICLTNNTSSSQTIDVWINTVDPDGVQRGPRVAYETAPLGDKSYSKTIPKELGEDAPSGEYTFSIYVGTYPDEPIDSSVVVYTKTGLGKESSSGVEPLTQSFELSENYPDPFNPVTTIRYGLPEKTFVRLEIFDMAGQRVAFLVDGERETGYHEVLFNAESLPSGTYFYRLRAGEFVETKKLVLMK